MHVAQNHTFDEKRAKVKSGLQLGDYKVFSQFNSFVLDGLKTVRRMLKFSRRTFVLTQFYFGGRKIYWVFA